MVFKTLLWARCRSMGNTLKCCRTDAPRVGSNFPSVVGKQQALPSVMPAGLFCCPWPSIAALPRSQSLVASACICRLRRQTMPAVDKRFLKVEGLPLQSVCTDKMSMALRDKCSRRLVAAVPTAAADVDRGSLYTDYANHNPHLSAGCHDCGSPLKPLRCCCS